MRLSKTSIRKLYKYFDLFSDMHLYIAIRLDDNTLIYPNRFLESVPNISAKSIEIYDSNLDSLHKEFTSINSFLSYCAPIYKMRDYIFFN